MFSQHYINTYVLNSSTRWNGSTTDLRVFIGTICNHHKKINPFETRHMPTESYFHNQVKTNPHLSKSTINHYMWLRDHSFYRRWEASYNPIIDNVYKFKVRSQVYIVELLGYKKYRIKNITYGDNSHWTTISSKHLKRVINVN